MKSFDEIKKLAVKTLETEADSVKKLTGFINDDFAATVQLIFESTARVIITGIGKSAIIANKIVATLNSTGTPAVYMHAADAIHGDLGTIQGNDIVICISKSGSTPEIKALVPLIKNIGNKLIALTGNTESFLALQADHILNATVDQEACPNNLAPTSSTTAQLALGDALAMCLLDCRGFSSQDFAMFHPGGSLGKVLYLKVADVYAKNMVPAVKPGDTIKTVIIEISSKRLGTTAVVENEKLVGVITDGDLRRMLEKETGFAHLTAKDIMNTNPKVIEEEMLAVNAMKLMKEHNVSQLLITSKGHYVGIIHIHDLVKEGII